MRRKRLTKKQLIRIVKEEVHNVLAEQPAPVEAPAPVQSHSDANPGIAVAPGGEEFLQEAIRALSSLRFKLGMRNTDGSSAGDQTPGGPARAAQFRGAPAKNVQVLVKLTDQITFLKNLQSLLVPYSPSDRRVP